MIYIKQQSLARVIESNLIESRVVLPFRSSLAQSIIALVASRRAHLSLSRRSSLPLCNVGVVGVVYS